MKSDTFANRYKILETIGRGGMGVVYKATDLMLDKTVALKVLSEKVSDQAALRFQAEAKAAGMLNHPNIVLVLDFGVNEDGEPYMVMEYIEGTSLSDLVKPSGLEPLESSLEIFQQICRALAQAHERGIIHRDIKPSNVIVATSEDGGPRQLTDFGIAKLIEADQGLTSLGATIGSPLYMSPEQVRGEKLDARSDIYSLGCLMYETLCGRPPLQGESQLETARMCQSVEPPPLSTVASRPVPSEIETIVGRCLKKDKNSRYQNVKALLRELSSVSSSVEMTQPEVEEVTEVAESASSSKGRFKTATLLAVPFFILIAIGLFYFSSVLQNSPEPVDTKKTSSDVHVSALGLGENNFASGELDAAVKIDSKNHPSETGRAPDSLELVDEGNTVRLYNATPAGLKKVFNLHKGIDELEIYGGTTFDGTQLHQLARLPRLRYLKLTDVPLKDEKLSELVGAMQLDRMKFEHISSIKGPGLDHLAKLRKLRDFSDTKINLTDEFMTHLQRVPVPNLSLKGCRNMNKERMKVFRNMPHLKSLVLENMLLKDEMLTPLAGLKIKEIRLGENIDLTKDCFSTLKTMKKLERIGLDVCTEIDSDSRLELAKELNMVYNSESEFLVKPGYSPDN